MIKTNLIEFMIIIKVILKMHNNRTLLSFFSWYDGFILILTNYNAAFAKDYNNA